MPGLENKPAPSRNGTTPQPFRSAARAPGRPAPSLETLATIRDDGSRRFLHPAESTGRFTTARRLVGYFLIALYVSLPWIPINGYPAVFLDVAERRFHLFGWTLAAQDLWLMFFLITGVGFGLFFVTALIGRVWCGWACPQTVFLDHVFRRVERLLEGDALRRRALDAAPWSAAKFLRRGAKQVLYVVLSAAVAHMFLAYFVSIPRLWSMVSASPGEHWGAFVFVATFTTLLYANFAWFREQLCIVLCPYGRLQSAMIDDHSLTIGYDALRGEPRGRATDPSAGACVDCSRCVQVCPVGIDIRQGLQIECIGCTACIDACDAVMDKLKRPRGLIRYDSQKGLTGEKTRWWRSRTRLYAALLLAGAGATLWGVSTIKPAAVAMIRMQGAPYFVDDAGVRNQFLVRVVNKRSIAVRFQLSVDQTVPGLRISGTDQPLDLAPLAEDVRPIVLQVPRHLFRGGFRFTVQVKDTDGRFATERTLEFLGPDPRLFAEAGRP